MWWCSETDLGKRDAWKQLDKLCHKYEKRRIEPISLFLSPREIAGPLPNLNGQTAMHQAVKSGSVASMQWLREHKVDIELQDKDGMRPLHCAAEKGQPEAIR